MARRIPAGARSDEQADLDAALASERGHFVQFVIGQQHDAAALAYPMNRHPVLVGILVDGAQRVRPSTEGIDAPLAAVWEALIGRWQIAQIVIGQSHAPQECLCV
ncbi:MAG: hypothetical protein R2855_09990 [Thermomicrobiales bacterium]